MTNILISRDGISFESCRTGSGGALATLFAGTEVTGDNTERFESVTFTCDKKKPFFFRNVNNFFYCLLLTKVKVDSFVLRNSIRINESFKSESNSVPFVVIRNVSTK